MTLKKIEVSGIFVRILFLRYSVEIDEEFDYDISVSLERCWLMFPI